MTYAEFKEALEEVKRDGETVAETRGAGRLIGVDFSISGDDEQVLALATHLNEVNGATVDIYCHLDDEDGGCRPQLVATLTGGNAEEAD